MVSVVVAVLAAAVVVWGPGIALAVALGVPPRWALVVAPALSAGVLGGWALLGGPVTWAGAAAALLACLLVVLVSGALRAVRRSSTPFLSRRDLRAVTGRRRGRAPSPAPSAVRHHRQGVAIAAAGALVGGGGLAAVLARSGTSIGGVNQLWDAAWHANLTRLIAQGGDGRPSVAGALIGAGWRPVDSWYPTGLHVGAALVDRLGGTPSAVVPVAAALGAVVAVHVLVVLPAVVAALVWELSREVRAGGGRAALDPRARGIGAGVAAVMATLPTAFPLDRLWSPAWPMTVGFVLALVTVAALVRCARAVHQGAMSAPGAVCVVALCLLGTGLTHPSGAVVVVLVGTAWIAGRAGGLAGRARWRALGTVAVGVGLAAGATVLAREHLPSVASVFAYDYRAGDLGAGLVSVAGLSAPVAAASGYGVPQDGGQPLVGALLLAGALGCAALRGARWLAALWALVVMSALETFVHIAAPLALVTGWFFNVESRLIALVALVGALAVGLAVAAGADRALASRPGASTPTGEIVLPVTASLRRRAKVARAASAALVLAVAVALVAVAVSSAQRAGPRVAAAYADRVVGPDAEAVMTALAAAPLPAGGRVLNDPLDGSPWLYALTGRMPMFTHYEDYDPTGDAALLLARLDEVDGDPAVRAALGRMRVCYVYASDALVTKSKKRPAGFEDLDDVASLEAIARSGGVVAYRVLPAPPGCRGGPRR